MNKVAELNLQISKLELKDGDIVMITYGEHSESPRDSDLRAIQKQLCQFSQRRIAVLAVPEGMKVESLSKVQAKSFLSRIERYFASEDNKDDEALI